MNDIIHKIVEDAGLVNCRNSFIQEGEILTRFDSENKPIRCVVENVEVLVRDWNSSKQRLITINKLWRETK